VNPPSTRDALIATLNARLKGVCAEWPEEEFHELVGRIADITLKYEARIDSVYDRRTADRLVEELNDVVDRSRSARERSS
jgi:hypothetical protein